MKPVLFFAFVFAALFFSGCYESGSSCKTLMDCKNGYDCVDGKCVEVMETGDNNSQNDNSNTDNNQQQDDYENPDEEFLFDGDNEAPVVAITSPKEDERVSGIFSITASASDANGNKDIMSVSFFTGETLLCKTGRNAPYSCTWNTASYDEGRVEIKAVVTDQAGLTGEDTVSAIVDNQDDPPVVKFISPKPGSMVMGKFKLNLDLYDDRGLKEVNFYVDGDLRETLSSEPWDIIWDTRNETLSSHTLKIAAKDDKDQTSEAEIIVTKIQGVLTATTDKWLNVIDLKTGSEVSSWQEDDKCYAIMPVPDTSYFFFSCATAGIKMYDLSDAKAPVLKGSFNTAEFNAGNMYLTEDKEYLIVNSGDTLVTIKIDDLEKGTMTLAATLDTYVHSTCDKGRIYTYEKDDHTYLVIPAWDEGIKLFDVTDPENIIETGGWDLPGTTEQICNIFVVNNYVLSGEWWNGNDLANLHVINIADPYDLVFITTFTKWNAWTNFNYFDFVRSMVKINDEHFLISVEGGAYSSSAGATYSIVKISDFDKKIEVSWNMTNDTYIDKIVLGTNSGHDFENAGLFELEEEAEQKSIVYAQINDSSLIFIDVTNQNDPTLWKYIETDKGWTEDVLVVK